MKKRLVCLLLLSCSLFLLAADKSTIPAMPVAVANNAVAGLHNGIEVYSLMGIGPKKTWDDVTNKMYILRLASGKWTEGRAVPGVAGRLGASAIGARGQIFVFGGYTVDGQGGELIVGDVNAYRPENHEWYRAADIPVPVDNAVIGLNRDRYIYLIGGRAKNGPINNVQVYDVEKDSWSQATPFPGTPVFSHAGGLTDGTIVFVDGARKNTAEGDPYIASDECWIGKVDHKDPNKIEWSKLPPHPGSGRFGIAGGAGEKEHRILFSGGSLAPHSFKGIGYDGKPAQISPVTFAYDLHGNRWDTIFEKTPDPRGDVRGIVSTPLGPVVPGGLLKNQTITAAVLELPKK